METIKVLPYPWVARDAFGLPCGLCPRDPDSDGGGPGQFVGARVDAESTKVLQKLAKGDDMRSPRQRTFYKYLGVSNADPELANKLAQAEPIEIPLTRYYKARIAESVLIPATAEDAKKVARHFIPLDQFFGPHMLQVTPAEGVAEGASDSSDGDSSDEGAAEGGDATAVQEAEPVAAEQTKAPTDRRRR